MIEKKKAFISQPTDGGQKEGLPEFVSRHLGKKLFPVHRLDKEVLGLMVFACSPQAAERLSLQFKEREISKLYHAWVFGRPHRTRDSLVHYLKKDSRKNFTTVFSRHTPGSKQAVLEYEVLKSNEDLSMSLLEVKLHTGRSHQIRAQLCKIGHSIVGDPKYRSKSAREVGLMIQLRSSFLAFDHPSDQSPLEFSLDLDSSKFFRQ